MSRHTTAGQYRIAHPHLTGARPEFPLGNAVGRRPSCLPTSKCNFSLWSTFRDKLTRDATIRRALGAASELAVQK